MALRISGLMAAAVMVAGLSAGSAQAEDLGFRPIWSGATLVDRSTEALATGHVTRAVRFARAALAYAGHDAGRRIAHQNLCLVAVSQGLNVAEAADCRLALLGPDQPLADVRGGLRLADRGADTARATLGGMIQRNIATVAGRSMVAALEHHPVVPPSDRALAGQP